MNESGKPTTTGRCWGVEWSAATSAGDKVYRAELDPAKKEIVDLSQPWKGHEIEKLVPQVAQWLETLSDSWVGFNFRFGLAQSQASQLLKPGLVHPADWSKELARKYGSFDSFNEAVSQTGRRDEERKTDTDATLPVDHHHAKQTYWGLRLLALLSEKIAILPWDHAKNAQVRVFEVSPTIFAANAGMAGYSKAKDKREQLLDKAFKRKESVPEKVRKKALTGAGGQALDAAICGMLAWKTSAKDHTKLASGGTALSEGHIYF